MEYDRAARKRLGRAVRAARTQAGYANRADFADKVKRSTRQIQALENGEDGVGPDTWAAAADALGWPLEKVYEHLDGEETRERADRSVPDALARASAEELAAEVLRRMKAGDGDVGRDSRDAAPIDAAVSDLTFPDPGHPDRLVVVQIKGTPDRRVDFSDVQVMLVPTPSAGDLKEAIQRGGRHIDIEDLGEARDGFVDALQALADDDAVFEDLAARETTE